MYLLTIAATRSERLSGLAPLTEEATFAACVDLHFRDSYFCLMKNDEDEKRRLLPYVIAIIVIGAVIIIAVVDWLFSL